MITTIRTGSAFRLILLSHVSYRVISAWTLKLKDGYTFTTGVFFIYDKWGFTCILIVFLIKKMRFPWCKKWRKMTWLRFVNYICFSLVWSRPRFRGVLSIWFLISYFLKCHRLISWQVYWSNYFPQPNKNKFMNYFFLDHTNIIITRTWLLITYIYIYI